MITDIIVDGFLAAVAAIGFGSFSYPPRRAFKYIGLLGAVGHALRYTLMTHAGLDIATSSFCASLCIGFLALLFGRMSRCPLTVLYIPALLPMIPGMYAYRSVFALVKLMQSLNDYAMSEKYINLFIVNMTVAVSVIFLLAVGATLVLFLFPNKAYTMTRRRQVA